MLTPAPFSETPIEFHSLHVQANSTIGRLWTEYEDVTPMSRMAMDTPEIMLSQAFLTTMKELSDSLSSDNVADCDKADFEKQLKEIDELHKTITESGKSNFNISGLTNEYSWFSELIADTPDASIANNTVRKPKEEVGSTTNSAFIKMMKERSYDCDKESDRYIDRDIDRDIDKDIDKDTTNIEPEIFIDSMTLLKLLEELKVKIMTYSSIENFEKQLEMTFVELRKANKEYDEYKKQFDKMKALKEDANAIAKKISEFKTKYEKAGEYAKKSSEFIGLMKSSLETLLDEVDKTEIAQIKLKMEQTEQKVKQLTNIIKLVRKANNVVSQIENIDSPVDTERAAPMCSICHSTAINSSFTCGHTGCFDCLCRCELKCPFCNIFSDGIIQLYI